jgi:hypothetical protein
MQNWALHQQQQKIQSATAPAEQRHSQLCKASTSKWEDLIGILISKMTLEKTGSKGVGWSVKEGAALCLCE